MIFPLPFYLFSLLARKEEVVDGGEEEKLNFPIVFLIFSFNGNSFCISPRSIQASSDQPPAALTALLV